MISNRSIKLLKYMKWKDDWCCYDCAAKNAPGFDHRSFHALVSNGYIDTREDPDRIPELDEFGHVYYETQYRISDRGLAYLEGVSRSRLADTRSWLAIALSVLALLVSFWSVCKPQPPITVYLGNSSNSASADTTNASTEMYIGNNG